MKKKDFYFELPEELIAQSPLENRDDSRLMVIEEKSGKIYDKNFKDILSYFEEGDTLVLNDTKVIPARIFGEKKGTKGKLELLLLKDIGDNRWEVLVKPAKKLKLGGKIDFGRNDIEGELEEIMDNGNRIVKFNVKRELLTILSEIGEMPLPHYITKVLEDKSRYQTVFAKELGSAAAPTAGLHFTPEIILELKNKGVNIVYITLHVGLGTFRPVKAENIEEHLMHNESYEIKEDVANVINKTKEKGKKLIAVGTTSVRTLESSTDDKGILHAGRNSTEIFIYPGYKFKIVDNIITNFHLPESTLIMLVSAKIGREKTLEAYKKAVEKKYRFFSFGDCMIII